jgi:hypothetical protein
MFDLMSVNSQTRNASGVEFRDHSLALLPVLRSNSARLCAAEP